MIELKNVIKKYGRSTVLNIENLQIKEEQIIGLLGNNGAGKSTLLRAILDLLNLEQGSVEIDKADISKTEAWKFSISSYLDEGFLIPYLKPIEYLEFIGKAYGINTIDLKVRLESMKDFLGKDILRSDKYIKQYSKGNIQKIGIAAALLPDTKYVILDEPFANLDPSSQNELKYLINKRHQEKGTCLIVSSHDLTHTKDLSHRIILLEEGTIKIDELINPQSFIDVEKYFFKNR
jgi:ABC-2 type transport system ATP-binding protein